jgi:hypothetical protein
MATPTSLPATFTSGQVLTASQMNNLRGAFRILQVVQASKTDTFTSGTINAGAEADITGLSASITPSSTSSQILVVANVTGAMLATGLANQPAFAIKLYRGATGINVGNTAGSRTRVTAHAGHTAAVAGMANVNSMFLDSPSTTSATTYKIAFVNASFTNSTGVFYCNFASAFDTDAAYTPRTASSLTLFEVSA